ncbi:DUF4913 domain-containing protein [Pseudonocardia sp. ICBG1293]|uniref:DUF4913 domain-containing protein n=1 Tax=Pseudonocardia sp. ICBG1293 TaxID=2844382 RepID=UPI001CCA0358|nr:DUF4913 domain-containing protein [Pseudonocardia sp. ICBG1293]
MTSNHDINGTGHPGSRTDSGAGHRDHAVLIETLRDDHTLLDRRVAVLADDLDTLAGTFDRLEETLRAARDDHDTPAPATPGRDNKDDADAGDRVTAPNMRVLIPWVRINIAELCERKLPQGQGRIRWCRSWWHHREAVARFGALYRAWGEATDPETSTALVTYYTHLDHTLEVLMSEHGPFSACPGGQHRPPGRGDPTVGYLRQDPHPDEPEPEATEAPAGEKEPQR